MPIFLIEVGVEDVLSVVGVEDVGVSKVGDVEDLIVFGLDVVEIVEVDVGHCRMYGCRSGRLSAC